MCSFFYFACFSLQCWLCTFGFYLWTERENQLFCLWSVWSGDFHKSKFTQFWVNWTKWKISIYTTTSDTLKTGIMKAKFLYSSNWRLQILKKKKRNAKTIIQPTVNVVHTDIEWTASHCAIVAKLGLTSRDKNSSSLPYLIKKTAIFQVEFNRFQWKPFTVMQ